MEERCRWREVADSLSHYNYPLELVKRVYVEHLQQYENRLRKNERTHAVMQISRRNTRSRNPQSKGF